MLLFCILIPVLHDDQGSDTGARLRYIRQYGKSSRLPGRTYSRSSGIILEFELIPVIYGINDLIKLSARACCAAGETPQAIASLQTQQAKPFAAGRALQFRWYSIGMPVCPMSQYTYGLKPASDDWHGGNLCSCSSGNVSAVTDSLGDTTSYTYDTSNRMKTASFIVSGSLKTTSYAYDANGNRQSITYHGGMTESYTYDRNNRLLTLVNAKPDSTQISGYSYTYYNNGLQHTKTDSYGTTTYTYDNDNRISQVAAPGKTSSYTYDGAGNRDTLTETYTSGQSSGYVDEASGSTIMYRSMVSNYYNYSGTNALLGMYEAMKDSTGSTVLTRSTLCKYDYNGNKLAEEVSYNMPAGTQTETFSLFTYNDTTTTFSSRIDRTENTYDGFNRLVKIDSIKDGNRIISEYGYDGDDQRVSKVTKRSQDSYVPVETNYLYDGQNVILETNEAGAMKARYIRGVNYIARVDAAASLSYFLFNGHGDVVQTATAAGVVQNQYDYDIFGSPALTVESYECSIRYSGYFYDAETGLYYLNARYYDSRVGRFLTEDSYRGSIIDPLRLNLYTYCRNEPIMNWDPTGFSDVAVRASNEINGNTVSYKAGSTKGNSTITVTDISGSSKTIIEGTDYYIGNDGKAYYNNDPTNAVRTTNESKGNIVSYSAGSSSGNSSIEVNSSDTNSKTTLKEGVDYYIGNDGRAYYYSNGASNLNSGEMIETQTNAMGYISTFDGAITGIDINDINRNSVYAQAYLSLMMFPMGYSGMNHNGVDGIWGECSKAATRTFQKIKGLAVTGIVDEKTLEAMKQSAESGETILELQTQYYKTAEESGAGLIELLEVGYGYTDQNTNRWGTYETINSILAVAEKWVNRGLAQKSGLVLEIRDLSKKEGGNFNPPHASHQKGIDYDMRLIRNDRKQGGTIVGSSTYSKEYNEELVKIILEDNNTQYIGFLNSDIQDKYGEKIRLWKGHDDHFHVRYYE